MADLLDRLKTALADQHRVDREIGQGVMPHVFPAGDPKLDPPEALNMPRRTSPRCSRRSHPPRSAVLLRRCRAVAGLGPGPRRL